MTPSAITRRKTAKKFIMISTSIPSELLLSPQNCSLIISAVQLKTLQVVLRNTPQLCLLSRTPRNTTTTQVLRYCSLEITILVSLVSKHLLHWGKLLNKKVLMHCYSWETTDMSSTKTMVKLVMITWKC